MALSGTLTGSADNSNYKLTCEWSATQSVTNNTSTITAKVYLQAPSGWSTISSNWSCVINGSTVTSGMSATVSGTKVLLGSRTWTVTHGSNGSLSTTISYSYNNGLSSAGTYTTKRGSGSNSITLNTIPRTSSFTLSKSSIDMGVGQTVSISRASSSFTHTIQYTFGSTTTTVATKTTSTSVSFTPPVSLANQVPKATSGTCTVKVTTYSGNTSIGSASKTFTLKVPASVKPSVTVAATYNNTLGGLSIAGKSTVKVVPTGTGSYGSTISSYSYSGAGLSGTGSSKTTGTLSSGNHTITVTATDSRGRTGTGSISFTVYGYSAPTLSISVYRTDSAGTANPNGQHARAKLTYAISNPNNANVNAKKYKIEHKKTTATTYTVLKDWTTFTGGYTSTSESILDLGSGWETTSSYDIKISIQDSYTTVSSIQQLSTISAIFNVEKNGVGIGKLHETGALDVGGQLHTTSGIYCGNTVFIKTDPNGNARFGYDASTTDVFMANSANNWLRLRTDKSMTYAGYRILMDNYAVLRYNTYLYGANSSGTNQRLLRVTSTNVVDVGDPNYKVAICSKDNPVWYNGSSDYQLITNKGGQTINGTTVITGSVYVNANGSDAGNGFVSRRYLNNKQQSAKCMIINSGGGCASILHRDETNAWEVQFLVQAWSASTGCVRPNNNGGIENGTSAYKWKVVYASNGTIQTSDERFKVKRGFVDTTDCFEMVKNIQLYKYTMLDKSKEDLTNKQLGRMAMSCESDDTKVHMGLMAQDLQKYECGKHIIVEGEYEKEDGSTDTMLHLNPLDMSMAIMGALKEEIQNRENDIVELRRENETLKNELNEVKNELLEIKQMLLQTLK